MNLVQIAIGVLSFWLALSASQRDRETSRELAAGKTLNEQRMLREASPETIVWIENRTGEAIREVGMTCESIGKGRSYGSQFTWNTTIAAEPKELWKEKYPHPIVLEVLRVGFNKGARCDCEINHQCKPGDKVTLVVEVGGRVTVKAKE